MIFGLLGALWTSTFALELERVEPPNWWVGFEDEHLQILLYGPELGEFTATVDYPGVSLDRTVRVASDNYLFLYLTVDASARPGELEIKLTRNEIEESVGYELRRKSQDPDHARGYSQADAIYLITPDRFANGDPRNDVVDGMGDQLDRDQLGTRHGGDIAGISQGLAYLDDMGFTAIWLNPVLENRMPDYSYHGYATTDYYRVDPRYGSNESYRELVRDARRRDMGVIMDMIVNHVGSEHWWMNDPPTADWINFGGNYEQTSHEHMVWQDPHVADIDRKQFADGWFVETMPDLNQRNPLLADYLVQNTLWWIEYLGLSGIRMDTYPYPDKDFMALWTQRVMQEYPNFNVVGEEWHLNPAVVAYWQRGRVNGDGYESELPSLMDFPVQNALRLALNAPAGGEESPWLPLYRAIASDFVYPAPENLVVFADNHDMNRIFTQVAEDYDRWRLAMAFILTTRGTPQIYYGTEILMANRASDDHGLIRSDFPGGWASDETDAFEGQGLTEQQKGAQAFLRKLLRWRQTQPALHAGELVHFVPQGPIYAYVRRHKDHQVLVVLNRSEKPVEIDPARFVTELGKANAGKDIVSGKDYPLTQPFFAPAMSALVIELD